MKEILSNDLSNGRLADLLKRAKLNGLSKSEEAVDEVYLQKMITSAANINAIDANFSLQATHAFDENQRLRCDQVIPKEEEVKAYQKLAPAIIDGLYSVPAVIE